MLCSPTDISMQSCAIPVDRLEHFIVFQPLAAGRGKKRLWWGDYTGTKSSFSNGLISYSADLLWPLHTAPHKSTLTKIQQCCLAFSSFVWVLFFLLCFSLSFLFWTKLIKLQSIIVFLMQFTAVLNVSGYAEYFESFLCQYFNLT